ncbi:hypothetical protein PQX77_011285 [Marasmius sp. AFHP31]|nr:hypothetical protein PQX77_011285 [Marasmius sp. AFHP31]
MAPQNLFETLRSPHAAFFPSEETSKWVQDAQNDIQKCEREIEQHQTHIRLLRAKQATHRRDIARYSSLSSPIRKLPSEILRRVFGFASIHNYFGHGSSWYPWYSGAFSISGVCIRWREIAMASPEIWSNISLSLEDRALEPVKVCLSRSGQCPLKLAVDEGSFAFTYEDEEEPGRTLVSELSRALVEHSSRWSEVDLATASHSVTSYISDHPPQATPLLKSVVCSNADFSWFLKADVQEVDISILSSTRPEPLEERASVLPWHSMRRLRMEYDGQATLAGIFQALQLGVNLQALEYFGYMKVQGADFYSEAVYGQVKEEDLVVSNITSLNLDMMGEEGFYAFLNDFFGTVTMPSLTSLALCCDCYALTRIGKGSWGSWPRKALQDSFERSAFTLTTLKLGGLPLSDSEVLFTLQIAPSVSHFTLSEARSTVNGYLDPSRKDQPYQTITKHLLKRLRGNTSSEDAFATQHPVLTKLTFLRLETHSPFDADEEFVDLVQSRWFKQWECDASRAIEKLRTVELHVHGGKLLPDIYAPLVWVESDGMMVSVHDKERRVI